MMRKLSKEMFGLLLLPFFCWQLVSRIKSTLFTGFGGSSARVAEWKNV